MEWNGNMSGAKCSQDISTNLKLKPNASTKMISYSPPTLFTNYFLFGFFFFLIFFLCFLEELSSFFLFLIFFLSFFLWTVAKIKLLQTFLQYNHRIPSIKDEKSLSKSCKHNGTMVMVFWSGGMNVCEVGEQRKANDVYGSSGLFLEFKFRWMMDDLAMVFN